MVGISALVASTARVHAGPRAQLTVYAAASLTDVFPRIDPAQRYSFGGSNTLAAQIQQGAPADVFASANMTLPNQLFANGLVREADRLHPQYAGDRRAEVEPGRHPHASTTSARRE